MLTHTKSLINWILLHRNIANAAGDAHPTPGAWIRSQEEIPTVTKKIAALKDESWVYLVAAFAILIFVGIATG